MRKVKNLAVVVTAAAILTVLGGCTSQNSLETTGGQSPRETAVEEMAEASDTSEASRETAPSTAVQLTFWSPTWHKDADEQVIADFEKMHPEIDIEASYYSSDDIKTNLKIAASSRTMPDMWYMWGGYNYANYYAKAGLCYDLTDYAESNSWEEKYIPSALDLCSYEGKIIALPQVYTGLVIWYRTDIFEEYGLTVPKDFEELEEICRVLKEKGITPFSTGSKHIFRYSEALLEYFAGPEGHDALNDLTADWNSPEVEKTFEKIKEWGDKGYFQNGFVSEDAANTKMYVFSKNAAMVMDNSGMASDVVANEYDGSLYSYFAFPTGKGTSPGRISSYVKVTQFSKDLSPEKFEAAMKFWDYYYSAESLKIHQSIEQPTAVKGAALSEAMALAEGLLETIDRAGSYTTTDLNIPSEVMDAIHANEEAVLLGEMKPDQATENIQAAVKVYKEANQ